MVNDRTRLFFFVILVMTAVSFVVGVLTIYLLYSAAFERQKAHLVETARIQARLMEAAARSSTITSRSEHHEDAASAAVSQILDAHRQYKGFGRTGEFALARREGNWIVFLLTRRHFGLDNPEPVPFDSELAEPMRRALQGEPGTLIGLDYRGAEVLAAYEPVAKLNLGIVAKIDMAEVRAPFIRAGIMAGTGALFVILVGAALSIRITNPLLRRLQEGEARNRVVLASTLDPVLTIDSNEVIQSASDSVRRVFGWKPEELIGQRIRVLIPQLHRPEHDGGLASDRQTGPMSIVGRTREFEAVRRDGTRFPIELSVSRVDIPGKSDPLFTGIIRDISGRKRAEQALKESERRFREMLQNVELIAVMLTPHGDIIFCNDFFCRLTGWSREEVLGRNWFDLSVPTDQTTRVGAVLREGVAEGAIRPHDENEILLRNGQRRLIAWNNTVLRDANRTITCITGLGVDITDQRQAEQELLRYREQLEAAVAERTSELEASYEQLRLADRLAAIGTLAAGLGHDMSNVLFPIRCRLDALDTAHLSAEVKEQLGAVRKSVQYLQQLTDGLHLLALDPDDPEASTEATDLRDWWEQVGTLLARGLPEHVALTLALPDALPPVAVAPHRLTQAVLNLMINAGEAIRQDGRVRVWAEAFEDRRFVRLGVTDNGEGMTPEVKRRALDPFFTTKRRGLGTGLGLSLVQSVVQSAGGAMKIDSAAGRGTTVVLNLPASTEPAAVQQPHADQAAAVCLQDRRTAAFVASLLEAAGFRVIHGDGAMHQPCSVWITEPSPAALEIARHGLGEPKPRIIVFGTAPAEWTRLGATVLEHPDDFDAIRQAITQAVPQVMANPQ